MSRKWLPPLKYQMTINDMQNAIAFFCHPFIMRCDQYEASSISERQKQLHNLFG